MRLNGRKRALEENSDGCMNSMERFATVLVSPYDLNKLHLLCIIEEAISELRHCSEKVSHSEFICFGVFIPHFFDLREALCCRWNTWVHPAT